MTLIAAVGLDTYPVVFGDLLISGPERARVGRRPGNVSTDPPLIEEDRHVVAPFGSTVDAARANSISWPGMEATFTCHVVLVHSPEDITVFNQIGYSESRTPTSISFSLEDRHISFGVNRQFADELTQSVRAGLAEL